MQDDNSKTERLILDYLQGKLTTDAQQKEWEQWISKEENQKLLQQVMDMELIRRDMAEHYELEAELEPVKQQLIGRLYGARVVAFNRRKVWKWVGWAAVVAAVLIGAWWIFKPGEKHAAPPVVEKKDSTRNNVFAKNDLDPATNNATLLLATGETIVLDSDRKGEIGWVGNTLFRKTDTSLSSKYFGETATAKEREYNTLYTRRAGRFTLNLSDGSVIYLNAASSIRFPAVFDDTVRRVEITGEVYFDVAKATGKPFKVTVNRDGDLKKSIEIQVLGTSFNVRAYKDDSVVVTRVVEGKVRIVRGDNRKEIEILTAGTQAIVEYGEVKRVDTLHSEEDKTWKDGFFVFDRATIREITNELALWYDLIPDVDPNIANETYSGTLPRNQSLVQVLKALNTLDKINYYIDGKKLVLKRLE